MAKRLLRAIRNAFLCIVLVEVAQCLATSRLLAQAVNLPAEEPAVPSLLPRDLSPWGMFASADVVVQAVIIGLAFASVVTWTVWLSKTIELILARQRSRAAVVFLSNVRALKNVPASGVKEP